MSEIKVYVSECEKRVKYFKKFNFVTRNRILKYVETEEMEEY